MDMGRKLFGSLRSLALGRGISSPFFFFFPVSFLKSSWEDAVKNR